MTTKLLQDSALRLYVLCSPCSIVTLPFTLPYVGLNAGLDYAD